MSGQTKRLIDFIVQARSQGNPVMENVAKTKLLLKGVDPEAHGVSSADDPAVIARLKAIAAEMSIDLSGFGG